MNTSSTICHMPDQKLSVERVALAKLPTEWGDFKIAGYRSLTSEEEFVVLFKGEMKPDTPTLVRIHSQCLTGDVLRSRHRHPEQDSRLCFAGRGCGHR